MSFSISILLLTMLTVMGFLVYLMSQPMKTSTHKKFIVLFSQMLIWAGAAIMGALAGNDNPELEQICDNITYIGAAGAPVTILLLSLESAAINKGLSHWVYLLFVPVLVTQVIIWTNPWHHLFYSQYSLSDPLSNVYGPFFYFHVVCSYACTLVGMALLIRVTIRSSGLLSMHSLLMLTGSIIPLAINICYTLGIGNLNVLSTPTAFSVTAIFYLVGIVRFKMFKVVPVALQTVVNLMSDAFIVVDTNMKIIDYNRAFVNQASGYATFLHGVDLIEIIKHIPILPSTPEECKRMIQTVAESGESKQLEWKLLDTKNENQYYTLELTPIMRNGSCEAVIVLFHNVTQHITYMEKLQNSQVILLERERLASLGQLIGGIAHNLKTPIMSVAGGLEQLQELIEEYRASIGDPDITPEDHVEISQDMEKCIGKMKTHMSYMSDIISTVKGQTVHFNASEETFFTVDELFKRIQILMRHELVKNACTLHIDMRIDAALQLRGDINSLVQVFDNIIINAIHAYEKKPGDIQITVSCEEENILFSIRDHGSGIAPEVKDRLFKEMITTKGKHGTGLGLYMAYSTIRGMFGGQLTFESEQGKGTEFMITIPV